MKYRYLFAFFLVLAGISVLMLIRSLPVRADGDLQEHPSCHYCGMHRSKFAHSRVYIRYDNETTVGTCSLHCAAVDLSLNIDKIPRAVTVADYKTRKLIDAEKAYWVIGGSKMGAMTRRAKWAFASEADARDFIAAFGGEAADYTQSVKATFEDMYDDLMMIRKKRRKMKMKKES